MIQVLFVCLGNICRSPAAEAIFTRRVEEAGLSGKIHCDSCGTGDYHIGEPSDARMIRAGSARGFSFNHRARQFQEPDDFQRFHYVIAMDEMNLADLQQLASEPDRSRLHRMVDFIPGAHPGHIPDPYHGGPDGFERVLDLLEEACAGLLAKIRTEHHL
jgi:protein-tyrosine phosphatase